MLREIIVFNICCVKLSRQVVYSSCVTVWNWVVLHITYFASCSILCVLYLAVCTTHNTDDLRWQITVFYWTSTDIEIMINQATLPRGIAPHCRSRLAPGLKTSKVFCIVCWLCLDGLSIKISRNLWWWTEKAEDFVFTSRPPKNRPLRSTNAETKKGI